MNAKIKELLIQSEVFNKDGTELKDVSGYELNKFAELIVRECAKELREAEQEANRAYKAKEVKERNTFDGYDFADMLEERFGVEESTNEF